MKVPTIKKRKLSGFNNSTKRRINVKRLFIYLFVILSFFLSSQIYAQTLCKTAGVCGDIVFHGALENKVMKGEELKISKLDSADPSFIARFALFLIEGTVERTGIYPINYKIYWISGINGAYSNANDDKKRIILIDPKWAEIIIEKFDSSLPVAWILAHEIGHHALRHTNLGETKEKIELSADRFAGEIIGLMRAYKWDAQRWASELTAKDISKGYPSKEDRIAAISEGYDTGCEKNKKLIGLDCSPLLQSGDINNKPNRPNIAANETQLVTVYERYFVAKSGVEPGAGKKVLEELYKKGIITKNGMTQTR